ncbi:4Fe-4S dicluster domain-containing protein [Gemmatimonadota bacterium]
MSIALISVVIAAALILLFFLPLDYVRRAREIPIPSARMDERDVMFSRTARVSGTHEYDEYYSRHPELQRGDDRIRAMPPLMGTGAAKIHSELSVEAERFFEDIYAIEPDGDVVEAWHDKIGEADDRDRAVREMIRSLGAVAVGATALRPEYLYSHKGRFPEDYGHAISLDHPSALLFLVEMDFVAMQCAPAVEVMRESAYQYYRAAVISKTVVAVLEALGYRAKSHHDAHYDCILPPLAVEAGLGEVGRHNILIADRYGTRVRIGAVTTDLPLSHDRPIDLGVAHFCLHCQKCAANCPSRSLEAGEQQVVRGVLKWPTEAERCYAYWRQMSSDCGICMAVCPFSHRSRLP